MDKRTEPCGTICFSLPSHTCCDTGWFSKLVSPSSTRPSHHAGPSRHYTIVAAVDRHTAEKCGRQLAPTDVF